MAAGTPQSNVSGIADRGSSTHVGAFLGLADTVYSAVGRNGSVFRGSTLVVCSVDRFGRIVGANAAMAKVSGYSLAELLSLRLPQLVVAHDRLLTKQALDVAIEQQTDVSLENRMTSKDGRAVDLLWSMQYLSSERCVMCVAHDVTAQKEVWRLRREFVATVSHEIMTPLSSIEWFLNLLKGGVYNKLSPKGMESLSLAERSIDRLLELVEELIELERVDARMDLKRVPVTMRDLFEESYQDVWTLAASKGITIALERGNDVDFVADATRLLQVMVNLLSNAIKFSPANSKISVEAIDRGSFVCIAIRDCGPGVPSTRKKAVFERFTQIDRTDPVNRAGNGLGLSICKAIVERHGGVIGVEDNVDQEFGTSGSKFWFTIPQKGASRY